ncbi:MAG: TonB family protein [Rhizomicrobium sp.]
MHIAATVFVFGIAACTSLGVAQAADPSPQETAGGQQPCSQEPVQNGCGSYVWPDGSKYVGEFRGGYMDGPATIVYADGSKLQGNFLGTGGALGDVTYVAADGSRITGPFRDPSRDASKPHTPVNYPFWRALFGGEAQVDVIALIDEHGNVTNAQLYHPINSPSFTKAATEAVSQWKYFPATVGVRPVKSPYMLQIQFAIAR